MVRRAALIGLAALAAACDAGFETPSIVVDLRVIGMKAEPPEVVFDFDPDQPMPPMLEDVDVTALLVNPGDGRQLEWEMVACPPTQSARCDDPEEPYKTLTPVTTAGAEPFTGTLVMDPLLLEAAVRADDLAGFGGIAVQVELWAKPVGAAESAAIYASKLVLYAPRVPAERVANTNPYLAELQADGVTFPTDACLPVAAGQELELLPVEPAGVRETYVLPTFDGGTRTITENLTYSWFATDGDFTAERTGGPIDLFGNVPPLDTTWRAPDVDAATTVRLWVVVRDERLGMSWHVWDPTLAYPAPVPREFCVEVTP